MQLLVINSHDYTPYIRPTYNVQSEDMVATWEDANYITHPVPLRTKIKGEVRLLLKEINQYSTFLTDMDAVKASDGSYTISVHDNRADPSVQTQSINALVTYESAVVYGTEQYNYLPVATVVTMRIEEK